MKVKITAQAYIRGTNTKLGRQRSEVIDTKTNSLFKRCKTVDDVRRQFLAFWNNLNPRSREIVRIVSTSVIERDKTPAVKRKSNQFDMGNFGIDAIKIGKFKF